MNNEIIKNVAYRTCCDLLDIQVNIGEGIIKTIELLVSMGISEEETQKKVDDIWNSVNLNEPITEIEKGMTFINTFAKKENNER